MTLHGLVFVLDAGGFPPGQGHAIQTLEGLAKRLWHSRRRLCFMWHGRLGCVPPKGQSIPITFDLRSNTPEGECATRPMDWKQYRDNYDRIFRPRQKPAKLSKHGFKDGAYKR